LAFVAVAVISGRPDETFAADLAIAWATDATSTRRHGIPKRPGGPIEEYQDHGCKDLARNLGPLLRWRYTEAFLPTIATLSEEYVNDPTIVKGLGKMEEAYSKFGWRRLQVAEDVLRNGRPLFHGTPEECRNCFWDCPWLAMRDDFPELCPNDRAVIADKVEHAFASLELRCDRNNHSPDLELEHYLAWFARHDPARLATLGARLRLRVLGNQDAAPGISFASGLPYDSNEVSSTQLLAGAIALAARECSLPPKHFFWSLWELHTLAFTCFQETDLKAWLWFAAQHPPLRREAQFYPLPFLIPRLLSDTLATAAREEAQRTADDPVDHSKPSSAEFDYWAWLGGLAGQPDVSFNRWVTEQMANRRPAGNRRFSWQLLWFRSATQAQLDAAWADGLLFEYLQDSGWRAMHLARRHPEHLSDLKVPSEAVVAKLPLDLAGTVFFESGRDIDVNKWGKQVFQRALELVGHEPFEREFWGDTIYTIDSCGEIVESNCAREDKPGTASHEALRPARNDPFFALRNRESTEEWNNRVNEGIRIWRKDQEKLDQAALDMFSSFGSRRALAKYRQNRPEEFAAFARELLTRSEREFGKSFHLGGFLAAVIDELTHLDPDFALDSDRRLRTSSVRVNVINGYGMNTLTASLWQATARGNSRCRSICAKLLGDAESDEELMRLAISAQAEGATSVLSVMCREMLAAPLAKDRALAVSILPWFGSSEAVALLDTCHHEDSSGWIHAHAGWAGEVARQEAASRRFYRKLLHETEANSVWAMLQVLAPALTPAALWWHRAIEVEEHFFAQGSQMVQALVLRFWDRSQDNCKRTPELFGRKLQEYLRGERFTDMRAPRFRLG
jgi:hypothetical protein